MPHERREILFYLHEITPALLDAAIPLIGKIPDSRDVRILDVMHTRDFHRSFHDIQARFRPLFNARKQTDGVMFRAAATGLFKKEQMAGFIVSDDVLQDILFDACKAYKISLPRSADKKVVAQDLAIGFELIFESAGAGPALALEEV